MKKENFNKALPENFKSSDYTIIIGIINMMMKDLKFHSLAKWH